MGLLETGKIKKKTMIENQKKRETGGDEKQNRHVKSRNKMSSGMKRGKKSFEMQGSSVCNRWINVPCRGLGLMAAPSKLGNENGAESGEC